MPLVSKRSRYVSGDLLVLLSGGTEEREGLTISTVILSLGFLREWRRSQGATVQLVQPICSLEITSRGSTSFGHWWDTEDEALETFEVLGALRGQGLFDVDDAVKCRRYLRDVASELEHLFEFGILSEEDS